MRVDPPGLRGLNRLAARLNDLMALGLIDGWHLGRWADGQQQSHQITFDTREDAATAATIETRSARPVP